MGAAAESVCSGRIRRADGAGRVRQSGTKTCAAFAVFHAKCLEFAPELDVAHSFHLVPSHRLRQVCTSTVQRSRLIQPDQRTLLFECMRGKQRHSGFLWSCPGFSITEVAVRSMFGTGRRLRQSRCVAFRMIWGVELAPETVRSQIGLAMSANIPPEESRRVNTKCWRQVAVTLCLLGRLGIVRLWLLSRQKSLS